MANEKLPNLESVQVGSNKYSVPLSTMLRHRTSSSNRGGDTTSSTRRGTTAGKLLWRPSRDSRKSLNYDARPYRPINILGEASGLPPSQSNDHVQQLGERLYPKVNSFTVFIYYIIALLSLLYISFKDSCITSQ